MKIPTRLIVTTLIAAIALPAASFAAKGDKKERRKKDNAPAVSFSQVDKDSDGSVTSAEFVAAMKEKLSEESAKTQFASLDKNSDGKLSQEEYSASATTEKKKRRKKPTQ